MAQEEHIDPAARILELEIQLRQALTAADSARLAKTAFLGNVSHELRTPLNAVLGMLGLLLESSLNEEQRLNAQTALDGANTLLRLINDILDLSRLEAGDLPLESSSFDLRPLLNDVVSGLNARARDKRLDLITHISGDLAGCYRGDRERLGQMLFHLVDNAIKFTSQGQVVLTARVLAQEETHTRLRISVADTGCGIPQERRRRIFEIFTQGDESSTRSQGGLGLGLTLVQRLLERMNGDLGMESSLGRGSTFWIDLPLEISSDQEVEPEEHEIRDAGRKGASSAEEPRRPFEGMRVLLVDDNSVNLKVAQRLLERQGCATETATNGLEAVEAAGGSDFDLILMDVQMPVMDGLEATRRIRALEAASGRRTPIVALTANVMAEDRARCFEAGMEEFLPKPVGPKVLAATLSRFAGAGRRKAA